MNSIYRELSGFGTWYSVPCASTFGWQSRCDCPSDILPHYPEGLLSRSSRKKICSRQGFRNKLGNPSFHSHLFSLYSKKHSVQKPWFSGVPKYVQPAFLQLLVPILSPGVLAA